MKREVIVVEHRQAPSLFGLFFAVILILIFWKWVLLVVGSIAAVVIAWLLYRAIRKDLREQDELNQALRDRADQQNAWFCAGDPRGAHGDFPPVELP